MGDFNLDLNKSFTHRPTENFLNTFYSWSASIDRQTHLYFLHIVLLSLTTFLLTRHQHLHCRYTLRRSFWSSSCFSDHLSTVSLVIFPLPSLPESSTAPLFKPSIQTFRSTPSFQTSPIITITTFHLLQTIEAGRGTTSHGGAYWSRATTNKCFTDGFCKTQQRPMNKGIKTSVIVLPKSFVWPNRTTTPAVSPLKETTSKALGVRSTTSLTRTRRTICQTTSSLASRLFPTLQILPPLSMTTSLILVPVLLTKSLPQMANRSTPMKSFRFEISKVIRAVGLMLSTLP